MKKPTIIFLLLCSLAVNAQMHENFTGLWRLDLSASDSIENILRAQGKSRLEIRVAKSMLVTQEISHYHNELHISIESKAISIKQNLKLNGEWTEIDTPKMGRVNARSYWLKRLKTLVTVMDITAQGRPARMTVRRSLKDHGQTMQLKINLKLENGTEHSAVRIFKRVN